MKVVDITGEIKTGMWSYEPPFPKFELKPLPKVPWVETRVYCEIFEGLHSQTGTYLETPAHYFGNESCYLLTDVKIESLLNRSCQLLMLDEAYFDTFSGRRPITLEMLENAESDKILNKDEILLIGTGWGKNWDNADYLDRSPYFTYDAMQWIISQKPYILASDVPRWENLEKPEGFFESFYNANILMLAPCVNLEKIKGNNIKLTVLPLNVSGTSCAPCRAIVTVED